VIDEGIFTELFGGVIIAICCGRLEPQLPQNFFSELISPLHDGHLMVFLFGFCTPTGDRITGVPHIEQNFSSGLS
jgi:hypothetical protein